jgi:hypothetical protein
MKTAIRNPSGYCDHLAWPDYLTDEARLANGYQTTAQARLSAYRECREIAAKIAEAQRANGSASLNPAYSHGERVANTIVAAIDKLIEGVK